MTNHLSFMAAAACACALTACEQPEKNTHSARAEVVVKLSERALPRRAVPIQTPHYMTEEFEDVHMAHSNGTTTLIMMHSCVTVDVEISEQDRRDNKMVNATIVSVENPDIILTGRIDAGKLYPADWMKPENCKGMFMAADLPPDPTGRPYIERRAINQDSTLPLPRPI